MRPVLLRWRGIIIYSYPAMLFVGIVSGIIAGSYAAGADGIDPNRWLAAALTLVAPALIGSRLLFLALHWNSYRRRPGRIFKRSQGGAAMYGGLPLMLICSLPLLFALGIPLGAFWD